MTRSHLLQLGLAALVLLIAIGAVIAVSLVAIRMQGEAAILDKEVIAKQDEALRVASAKAALPVLARTEEALLRYRVKAGDIVPFLERLEKQGRAEGVAVEVISVNPEQGRIALSLTVRGSFDAVVRTIGIFEYGPHDTIIKTVALDSASEEGAKKAEWTAAIVMSVGTDQQKKK